MALGGFDEPWRRRTRWQRWPRRIPDAGQWVGSQFTRVSCGSGQVPGSGVTADPFDLVRVRRVGWGRCWWCHLLSWVAIRCRGRRSPRAMARGRRARRASRCDRCRRAGRGRLGGSALGRIRLGVFGFIMLRAPVRAGRWWPVVWVRVRGCRRQRPGPGRPVQGSDGLQPIRRAVRPGQLQRGG